MRECSCGYEPNAATAVPGDLTVCLRCGRAWRFGGLGLEPVDLDALPPATRHKLRRLQRCIVERRQS